MDDILKPAANLANIVLQNLSKKLGGVTSAVQPQKSVLTEKQQLDLFLSMSEGELEQLKNKFGVVEFKKYVNRMMEISGANNGRT